MYPFFTVSKLEINNPLTVDNNQPHYPPCNVWLEENGDCVVEMAVAGFSKEDLTIKLVNNKLTISGNNKEVNEKREWIKRELAKRKFIKTFEVLGNYSIEKATLKNGILMVILKNESKTISVDIIEE